MIFSSLFLRSLRRAEMNNVSMKFRGYKKAGVILGNITDASAIQQNLFDEIKNRPQRIQLMKNIDKLNHRFGLKSIRLAVEGEDKQAWHSKSEYKSGNYLSDINEILTIKI